MKSQNKFAYKIIVIIAIVALLFTAVAPVLSGLM